MKFFLSAALYICSLHGIAQTNSRVWASKKCAVVLTYDDAIAQHLDNALPVLDSLGLKATFYITAFSDAVQQRLNDWKQLAANGHELGNHTLYHPCDASQPGRSWVSAENDLSRYTVKRLENEIRMTNLFLQSLDGKKKRTFAYTCGDTKVQDSLFINGLKKEFIAARAVTNEQHAIDKIDLYNVDCYVVNNHSYEQMKAWVDKALESNNLLVILFHGVGGGNGLNVSLEAHRKLLSYINQHKKDIYIAPMVEIASYIRQWQSRR
jgi:peptidoglycan-N-acetylglucosamine deacetylase